MTTRVMAHVINWLITRMLAVQRKPDKICARRFTDAVFSILLPPGARVPLASRYTRIHPGEAQGSTKIQVLGYPQTLLRGIGKCRVYEVRAVPTASPSNHALEFHRF